MNSEHDIYKQCETIRLGDLYTIITDVQDRYIAFPKSVKGVRMNWYRIDVRFVWLDR